MIPTWASPQPDGFLVRVKAVPGSSSNKVQGVLRDHLKVRVSAPPEGGKANAAIATLLADLFGVQGHAVTLLHGGSVSRKVFAVRGATESVFAAKVLSDLRPGG